MYMYIWYAASKVTQEIFAVLVVQGYHVVLTQSFKLLSIYIYIHL